MKGSKRKRSIDRILLTKVFKSPKKIKVVLYDISDAIDLRWWLKRNEREFDMYKSMWVKNKYIFKIYGNNG